MRISDWSSDVCSSDLASRAHLRRAASATGSEAPGCGVETPWGCPAVRRGRTLTFDRSDHLGACPRLRDRGGDPCSAVCVPITILGTPTAVIHAPGRSEERRVGKECVSTCRTRWSTYH